MYPEVIFTVAGVGVNLYLVCYALGFVSASGVALVLARERDFPLLPVVDAAVLGILAVLIGTPLVVLLLQPVIPYLPANWSFAQILAMLMVLGVHRLLGARQLPMLGALDLLAVAVALYIVFARRGCFASGCCHGQPAWGLPWAVVFSNPHTASIYRGIPIHPTQLYEAAGCLALFVVMLALHKRPAWHGKLLFVLIAGYGLIRFVVEIYRGDIRAMVGPLSLAQVLCAAMLLVGGGVLAWQSNRARRLERATIRA